MARSYACIISPDVKRDKDALVAAAREFAYSIEVLDDGILFDVSGLERLIGKPDKITQKILAELERRKVHGSVAVAGTVDTAILLARQKGEGGQMAEQQDAFEQLPLRNLDIGQDTLNVFSDLGIRSVQDLLAIPRADLIGRYGREFQDVIDTIEQRGASFITPNVKDSNVEWSFDLDQSVENFEQLIFVLNHGLERLLAEVEHCGFSTEHLDLLFKLKNRTEKSYEIKTSFPTLDRAFWLKLINLRAALDPPEADIVSVKTIAHFTHPRPAQKGLYAVSRPEPESLLLTVNKLKKLVGETHVGVPMLLNQRLAEPFALDADAMPDVRTGSGSDWVPEPANSHALCDHGIIAFNYYRPPLRAEVLVRDGRLIFIKTHHFSGHVTEYSGVWKSNSKWWESLWKTQEWDIEVEGHGIYRLLKAGKEWFLTGEYD
ncbi:MAG: hypothetical protein IPI64_11425 [Chloracidobacterium sp.]|nr:hypothetical protein [Chloracidobacterium sp.]